MWHSFEGCTLVEMGCITYKNSCLFFRSGTEEYVTQKVKDLQEIWDLREEGDRMKHERTVAAKASRIVRKCPGVELVDARLAKMREGLSTSIT